MATKTSLGMAAWLAVLKAQSVVTDRLEQELEHRAGLSLAAFVVLLHLSDADQGRLRMNELAHSVVLSKSGLTRLIDRMVAAGWIERTPGEGDRRVMHASITRAGREAFARALPVHNETITEVFASHLTRDEIDAMTKGLQRVVDGNGYPISPCIVSAADVLGKPEARR